MPVGILIVAHGNVGKELLDTARSMLGGKLPLHSESLSVSQDCNPDDLIQTGTKIIGELDSGDGVIVLTDMFGSTPSNIANRLSVKNQVYVLSGLNLPMLIRLYNYAACNAGELIDKALNGGRSGIMLCANSARK